MARFAVVFGILLILLAVGFLLLFLAGSEIEFTGEIIEGFVCESGETLDQKYRQTYSSDGAGTTIDFYCVDEGGDERDITFKMVIIGVLGFLGLFLPGLFMTIVGANVAARRATQSWNQVFMGSQGLGDGQAALFDLRANTTQYQAKNMQDVQEIMQQFYSQTGQATSGGSLSDKLKELDDARQQGLISQSEYDRMRQAILDNMDN